MTTRTSREKILGNYRIIDEIAKGGFGTTYKAQHILLGELACIKHCGKLTPEHNKTLMEEARAMWDLRHFAIPAIRDLIETEDGSLALVMSYIPGLTLKQIVEKVGRLPPETVCWITDRTINAFLYLHRHGVIHGDYKPGNVIVQHEDHTVSVVDFGLSMVKPKASDRSKGYTKIFAPPEAISGRPLIPQSDFYSLGMTMIYMLNGGNLEEVGIKQIPSDVPTPLFEFIKRLIVTDPLERPNWENEDLSETIIQVRRKSFGRVRSKMEGIPGLA